MKYYVLRVGCMYLEWIDLDTFSVCTEFIKELKLTDSKSEAMLLDEDNAKELKKKVYIITGSEVELDEYNEEIKTEI